MSLINRTFIILSITVCLVIGGSYFIQTRIIQQSVLSEARIDLMKNAWLIRENIEEPDRSWLSTYLEKTGLETQVIDSHCVGRGDTFYTRSDQLYLETCMGGLNGSDLHIQIRSSLDDLQSRKRQILYIHLYILIAILLIFFVVKILAFNNIWTQLESSLSILKERELHRRAQRFPRSRIKEIDELNQELNELSVFLNREYRSQKEYIENLSHEIFTPISNIRSQLELLLQSENLEEQDVKMIAKALQGLERLIRVNRSLILLTKVENRQNIAKNEFDLNDTLDQVLDTFEDQIRRHNIHVEKRIDAPIKLHTSKGLVEILVMNLIRNAIVHNIDGGELTMVLTNDQLTVRNTGAPISLRGKRIFKRFSSESTDERSVGLGLAISKRICRALGLMIKYEFHQDKHQFVVDFQHVTQ